MSQSPQSVTPPPPRRSVVVPIIGALVLVLGVSGYLYWQRADQPPPPAPAGPDTGAYLEGPGGVPGPDILSPLTAPGAPLPGASDLLLARPGDKPLEGEPAGLSPYRGGTRLGGISRSYGGTQEELAFWTVPGASAREVAMHYRRAAAEQGYTVALRPDGRPAAGGAGAATRPEPDHPINRIYLRPGADGRPNPDGVLTVFVAADPAGGVRVVIWLRHPAQTPGG